MNNQQAAVGPRPGMGRMGPAVVIPKGVGAPPPPGMDPRRGKLMCIKVRMLDDSVGVFHLGHKALGQALFDEVCRHLNLLESDYFGLEFTDCYGNHCWLDKDKPILRQITATQSDARFYFIVKFYTPNPADLEEEYTRYLMALQIKRDLASGEMLCNENTAALLASYIVQSDCGDFSMDDYPDSSYLSSGRFLPNQSLDFQNRVRENHMKLIGMSPGESDLSLLETARRSDFYGVKLHAAKDVEGTDVCLTVAHLGIRVFHQLQCVSTFSWAKIRKLSFKRRKLLIKLHPESYQYYKETIEFSFEGRNECKCFWKKCVEHHAFFRCSEVNSAKKSKEARLFSKGSSFRFHGRTQKQLIDYVREHHKRREPFTRPIRPGLSSRSDRLSRPAQLNMSTAYSTVSERAINVVTGIPSSSCSQQQATSRRQSGGVAGGGVSRATGGGSMPHINGQSHPHVSDATGSGVVIGSRAGSRTTTAPNTSTDGYPYAVYSSASAPRPHRHRPSLQKTAHPSGAMSDGERMCASDVETCVSHAVSTVSSSQQRYAPISQPKALSAKPKHYQTTISSNTGMNSESVSEAEGSADPLMSLSLPNVLGADVQLVCKEFELKCECPPKSASGDNFLAMQQRPREYDNLSEESYRLSDHEQRSSHMETNPPSSSVYATTFTTKRVGNVIVKRIVTNSRSTPNTTDDEDLSVREAKPSPYGYPRREGSEGPYSGGQDPRLPKYQNITYPSSYPSDAGECLYANQIMSGGSDKRVNHGSSSAPSSSVEYPVARKLVPVEIDGPNINLDEYRRREEGVIDARRSLKPLRGAESYENTATMMDTRVVRSEPRQIPPSSLEGQPRGPSVIYTSTGAILQKPKVIPDSDACITDEVAYGQLKLSQVLQQAQKSQENGTTSSQSQSQISPKTYGAVGPLPGKVITKENLVVTPEGLREKRPKPVVPPKPKNLISPITPSEQPLASSPPASSMKQQHPIVNMQRDEVESMQKAAKVEYVCKRPALISIQSEDRPDIQKCHLFNSEIPYILTMRNISSEPAPAQESNFSTFKDPIGSRTLSDAIASSSYESGSLLRNRPRARSPDSFKRRKSLDLVPRKRLPSPGNFSSQDHSISPTTPESGDVLEYVLRRRSASNERSALAKRGRRGDPRRQTQPVRFNIPPSPEIEHRKVSFASEPNLIDDSGDDNNCDTLSLQEDINSSQPEGSVPMNRSFSNLESSTVHMEERVEIVQKSPSEQNVVVAVLETVATVATVATGEEPRKTSLDDELPPLPPPPPPPPPLVPGLFRDPVLSEPMPAPPTSLGPLSDTSTDTVPFADESASSRASFASKEDDASDRTDIQQTSSATLRTPTGVLWTDF